MFITLLVIFVNFLLTQIPTREQSMNIHPRLKYRMVYGIRQGALLHEQPLFHLCVVKPSYSSFLYIVVQSFRYYLQLNIFYDACFQTSRHKSASKDFCHLLCSFIAEPEEPREVSRALLAVSKFVIKLETIFVFCYSFLKERDRSFLPTSAISYL